MVFMKICYSINFETQNRDTRKGEAVPWLSFVNEMFVKIALGCYQGEQRSLAIHWVHIFTDGIVNFADVSIEQVRSGCHICHRTVSYKKFLSIHMWPGRHLEKFLGSVKSAEQGRAVCNCVCWGHTFVLLLQISRGQKLLSPDRYYFFFLYIYADTSIYHTYICLHVSMSTCMHVYLCILEGVVSPQTLCFAFL